MRISILNFNFCFQTLKLCSPRKFHHNALINVFKPIDRIRFCPVYKKWYSRSVCEDNDDDINEDSVTDSVLKTEMQKLHSYPSMGHGVLLIQPRIRFGPNHVTTLNASLKMDEAIALVQTLPGWSVVEKIVVSTSSPQSPFVFGKGNLEKLKQVVIAKQHKISAIFIGQDMLRAVQNTKLEEYFGIPVYDRYQIVLQIFHDHARTKEAKLQIALAEIPYLRVKLAAYSHTFDDTNFKEISCVGGSGETVMETRRRILFDRELRLKRALEKVRKQRLHLRQSESRNKYPTIAVVGYTNCGKTTLIKSFTNDARLTPEDKLFATLDVTFHAGYLPSMQKVLYIDTVGFISDVPTSLIQCFHATLEDIRMADLIIHIRDISHPDTEMQKTVVLKTLRELQLPEKLMDSIVEVGNKIDLLECTDPLNDCDLIPVSATKGDNLAGLLDVVQEKILENTNFQVHLFRVPNGGEEYRWLLQEAAIRDSMADETDANYLILEVVISSANLSKFFHEFGDLTISIEDITTST